LLSKRLPLAAGTNRPPNSKTTAPNKIGPCRWAGFFKKDFSEEFCFWWGRAIVHQIGRLAVEASAASLDFMFLRSTTFGFPGRIDIELLTKAVGEFRDGDIRVSPRIGRFFSRWIFRGGWRNPSWSMTGHFPNIAGRFAAGVWGNQPRWWAHSGEHHVWSQLRGPSNIVDPVHRLGFGGTSMVGRGKHFRRLSSSHPLTVGSSGIGA